MRYLVDEALCCGHGQCALKGPDLYRLDDEGVNARVGQMTDVPAGQEDAARAGAAACPDAAIQILDG